MADLLTLALVVVPATVSFSERANCMGKIRQNYFIH